METPTKPQFKYIDPENLPSSLKSLGKNMVVSTDCFELWSDYLLQDLEWNSMDQHHRPHVHSTYQDCARLFHSEGVTVSVTKAGPWPFFVMLTDIRLRPGFYYQSYTILGLWYVHCVQYAIPKEGRLYQRVDFHVLSHRLFRFMHKPILKRLININEKLNKEDFPIRQRRLDLRKKGYHFKTDEPNFLNSNELTDNVIAPLSEMQGRFPLKEFSSEIRKISVGQVDLLVKTEDAGRSFLVWPEVCPHEGGPLAEAKVCDKALICPWHGLKFQATTVNREKGFVSIGQLHLSLDGDDLIVRPQAFVETGAL